MLNLFYHFLYASTIFISDYTSFTLLSGHICFRLLNACTYFYF